MQQNLLIQQNNNNIDEKKHLKYSQSSASSNLNSFALPDVDQASNLLVALQGFQMATSRSNVILIAVGGIVSILIIKRNT